MSGAGPYSSPGFWLHHAALTWRQACEERLGNITYPQFNILSAVSMLTGRDGPPTQQDAADFARMDRKMASKIIQTLEHRDLLVRVPDAADARLRRLRLTDAGQDAVRQCVLAARQADEQIFGRGPATDRLRDDLRAIAQQRTNSAA